MNCPKCGTRLRIRELSAANVVKKLAVCPSDRRVYAVTAVSSRKQKHTMGKAVCVDPQCGHTFLAPADHIRPDTTCPRCGAGIRWVDLHKSACAFH